MADKQKGATKTEIIRPPQTIQSKVEKGGPGAVDLAALERAEDVIESLADDYLEWVAEDLQALEKAFEALKSGDGSDKKRLNAVFEISHDMKGQGGSFGFDLVTSIGDHLCRLVEKFDKVGPREIDMVRVHIDALRVVVKKQLKGDGGKEGRELLLGLTVMGKKAK